MEFLEKRSGVISLILSVFTILFGDNITKKIPLDWISLDWIPSNIPFITSLFLIVLIFLIYDYVLIPTFKIIIKLIMEWFSLIRK